MICIGDRGLADGRLDHLLGDVLALRDSASMISSSSSETDSSMLIAVLVGQLFHVGGDVLFAHILAEFVIEHEGASF